MPFCFGTIGLWESEKFVGAVVYGSGSQANSHRPFRMHRGEVCELVRMALAPGHKTPVSKVISISAKMLKKQFPHLRCIVSYADVDRGHYGGIYQASGWAYVGAISSFRIIWGGRTVHPRSLVERYGSYRMEMLKKMDPNAKYVRGMIKNKYAIGLDPAAKALIAAMSKPYPKLLRVGSRDSAAPADQAGQGGASPTPTLQP
jgi:hypothetical protein